MPGPQREGDSPFIFDMVERGLALPRGVEDAAPPTTKNAPAYSTQAGAFFVEPYTLSIIRATISVAVLTYSVMLNCLTTSTS